MTTNKFCMNEDEIQIICQEYLSGMKPQAIADKHYCSRPTIRNYLKRKGIIIKSSHSHGDGMYDKKPVAMILHDWQCGMTADKITSTYKFKTKRSLYNFITSMRTQGYDFRRRKV